MLTSSPSIIHEIINRRRTTGYESDHSAMRNRIPRAPRICPDHTAPTLSSWLNLRTSLRLQFSVDTIKVLEEVRTVSPWLPWVFYRFLDIQSCPASELRIELTGIFLALQSKVCEKEHLVWFNECTYRMNSKLWKSGLLLENAWLAK